MYCNRFQVVSVFFCISRVWGMNCSYSVYMIFLHLQYILTYNIYASMVDFMKICWGLPRTLGRKKFHFAIGGLTRLIHHDLFHLDFRSLVVWWVCTTNIRHVSNEKVMSQVFVYIFSPPSLSLKIEVFFQSSITHKKKKRIYSAWETDVIFLGCDFGGAVSSLDPHPKETSHHLIGCSLQAMIERQDFTSWRDFWKKVVKDVGLSNE